MFALAERLNFWASSARPLWASVVCLKPNCLMVESKDQEACLFVVETKSGSILMGLWWSNGADIALPVPMIQLVLELVSIL